MCAAHPESGTAPASRHGCQPHVGRGQPGCLGACQPGTRAQRPGSARGRNAGREPTRGVTGWSRQLQTPAPALCPRHSPSPGPTGPRRSPTAQLPIAPGRVSQRSPLSWGDAAPLQGCSKGQRPGELCMGGPHKGGDQRGGHMLSPGAVPTASPGRGHGPSPFPLHARDRGSSTGTRAPADSGTGHVEGDIGGTRDRRGHASPATHGAAGTDAVSRSQPATMGT